MKRIPPARKADIANNAAQRAEAPRPNNTGMPDNLKAGIESLSGFSMDDVRVHYNSSKPATVQALAYTQGTDIHVAPGQEKHLPHEAWHVAQQMAGRVSPTTNINGLPVNDNAALEHEADVMGEKAVQCKEKKTQCFRGSVVPSKNTMQRIVLDRSKKVCYATDDVYIEDSETRTRKLVLSDNRLKCDFTNYFNNIFNKLGFGEKIINSFEISSGSQASWDNVYGEDKQPVDIPIKAKDIAEDYDGIHDLIDYEFDKACALQALYCAENGSELNADRKKWIKQAQNLKDKDGTLKNYHDEIMEKGINYQSDMGAFLLYTAMGYSNAKKTFPDGTTDTLQQFIDYLLSPEGEDKRNQSYILLQDNGAHVGHAIAVVDGKVRDVQGAAAKIDVSKDYKIKNIYAKD